MHINISFNGYHIPCLFSLLTNTHSKIFTVRANSSHFRKIIENNCIKNVNDYCSFLLLFTVIVVCYHQYLPLFLIIIVNIVYHCCYFLSSSFEHRDTLLEDTLFVCSVATIRFSIILRKSVLFAHKVKIFVYSTSA
jgi:hypothetical protein